MQRTTSARTSGTKAKICSQLRRTWSRPRNPAPDAPASRSRSPRRSTPRARRGRGRSSRAPTGRPAPAVRPSESPLRRSRPMSFRSSRLESISTMAAEPRPSSRNVRTTPAAAKSRRAATATASSTWPSGGSCATATGHDHRRHRGRRRRVGRHDLQVVRRQTRARARDPRARARRRGTGAGRAAIGRAAGTRDRPPQDHRGVGAPHRRDRAAGRTHSPAHPCRRRHRSRGDGSSRRWTPIASAA